MPGGVVPPRALAPTKALIRPSQVLRKQKISQRRSTEMRPRKPSSAVQSDANLACLSELPREDAGRDRSRVLIEQQRRIVVDQIINQLEGRCRIRRGQGRGAAAICGRRTDRTARSGNRIRKRDRAEDVDVEISAGNRRGLSVTCPDASGWYKEASLWNMPWPVNPIAKLPPSSETAAEHAAAWRHTLLVGRARGQRIGIDFEHQSRSLRCLVDREFVGAGIRQRRASARAGKHLEIDSARGRVRGVRGT